MSTVNVQIGLHELLNGSNAQIQLSVPQLVEKALMRNEGKLTSTGAVSASTGKYTGRSPKDKFIVKEASVADKIAWGAVNQPISEEHFNKLYTKVLEYLKEKEELFVFKGFAGADRN
ncbi:TPA: phosphoenolpyruvate carboxykinase (ATP), partial [Bacillus anthracis]|nr:phosphoenolpyruvate carboxykinase (ATP) [Bacillus anthracis]